MLEGPLDGSQDQLLMQMSRLSGGSHGEALAAQLSVWSACNTSEPAQRQPPCSPDIFKPSQHMRLSNVIAQLHRHDAPHICCCSSAGISMQTSHHNRSGLLLAEWAARKEVDGALVAQSARHTAIMPATTQSGLMHPDRNVQRCWSAGV